MNRIDQVFANNPEGDLLNVYFTAGYPQLDDTRRILKALESAGADLVEIGMPYSDPMADGPTIQQSNDVAIANGMKMSAISATILPYPTVMEMNKRAAGAYFSPKLFGSAMVKRVVGFVQKVLP